MDQLLAQRTLSLLHHLMRLVLQLHGSILANIEGLESQVGHRGTTLSLHHPYSSSMAPMDVPILLPGIPTTSTHSTHPTTVAPLAHFQPSVHPPHHHATKRTLSPQPHPPSTKHHRINITADTPAPPATPRTADPTPAPRRSKAPRARSHSPNSDDSTSHAVIDSGAVKTIAAPHRTAGNPSSSHRTNLHSGTRTITTGKPYGHHSSSLVISRRRDPYQPQERLQGTPELGFRRRKNAPNAVRVQGTMAIASPATDSTFGDYAAAAASYIYNYESWTSAASYTSSIKHWLREMYRFSSHPYHRNPLFTPSFCSIEGQRGTKRETLSTYSIHQQSCSQTNLTPIPYITTFSCWRYLESVDIDSHTLGGHH